MNKPNRDSNRNSLKKEIREMAQMRGATLVGFCSAEKFLLEGERFKQKKEQGLVSGFLPLNYEAGFSPEKLLNKAKTFIVVGLSYRVTKRLEKQQDFFEGKLARFARVRDYHYVLKEILQDITEFLKFRVKGDYKYKIFVDSCPLPEKELAFRAGLGFMGKNNLIINPVFGSFLVFGEILTDLPLKPDQPLSITCQDCNLCVQACPTGALKSDDYYEPGICLSELTQSDGFPSRFYSSLGMKIWGCDLCQEVCPYNKNAPDTNCKEFLESYTGKGIDILELFSLSGKKFRKKYQDYPFSWRGKKVIMRNAAIVLGNIINIYKEKTAQEKDEIQKIVQNLLVNKKEELRKIGRWIKNRPD